MKGINHLEKCVDYLRDARLVLEDKIDAMSARAKRGSSPSLRGRMMMRAEDLINSLIDLVEDIAKEEVTK